MFNFPACYLALSNNNRTDYIPKYQGLGLLHGKPNDFGSLPDCVETSDIRKLSFGVPAVICLPSSYDDLVDILFNFFRNRIVTIVNNIKSRLLLLDRVFFCSKRILSCLEPLYFYR